jgi:hypothetical protein
MQPGEITKVVSLNPPIVNVQPGFMRLREGAAEAEKRPVIPNVPFVFPVFGDFGITGAIKVGMTVSLIAAERSIKTWVEQGGTVDPGIDSSFDLADCIAIPGLPNKTVSWDVPDDGIQIGTIDGASVVKVTADAVITKSAETVIQEGEDYAVQFTALKDAFDTLVGDFNTLVTAFLAHMHPTAAPGAPSVYTPVGETPAPSAASVDGAKVDTVRLP